MSVSGGGGELPRWCLLLISGAFSCCFRAPRRLLDALSAHSSDDMDLPDVSNASDAWITLWCSRSTTTSSCRTSAINSHATWFCHTYFYSLTQSLTPQIDRQTAYTIHNPSNPQFLFWESKRKNNFLLKIGERIKKGLKNKRIVKLEEKENFDESWAILEPIEA